MAFSLPNTLKLAQLKQLAFKCGISTSGTKPILTRRLLDDLALLQPLQQPAKAGKQLWMGHKGERTRILSIDMGIRNLAYCMLDVPPRGRGLPCIHAWHRLAVSSAPVPSPDAAALDADAALATAAAAAKEAFDPATLSAAAYALLRHRLLPLDPTHILIERQRFRSMGSKHILEWTIRVNMFESILYAVLCTLREEGVWRGEVRSIAPGKVGPFWIGEEGAEAEAEAGDEDGVRPDSGVELEMKKGEERGKSKKKIRRSQNAKIKNKGLKIDLVRSWLEGGDVVGLGNEQVESVARAYREKWDRAPGARRGPRGREREGEKMGKLDDLADCLLQGMAWVQWEENKRALVKNGVEALLES
ncbi:uncharacterized protein L3040_001219 [Drepanopeziza brunnea f. sp. 'multigermtubi']|uniref:uncharacterized protein n=1 Tax=Drepanopeziza brunnea f. sp. 'multigermtubi' TaxID=698441 RepID=UPI00239B10C3|nr:hypothetical protein L3040_001219 [Drepanopeziza brunnea f. sp. 'multigermtubi']